MFEMAVLSKIADAFQYSNIDWYNVAKNLGYDEASLEEFCLKDNPPREFVNSLTIHMWDAIFLHFDIKSSGSTLSTISDVSKLANIFGKKLSREIVEEHHENKKEKSEYINVIDEISCRVSEWRAFGRVLDFTESYLDNIDRMVIEKLNEVPSPYKLHVERNKYLMNDALKYFNNEDIEFNHNSWKFWHEILNKFRNGKEVICEIERFFPLLISETSFDLVHVTSSVNMTYIGHPIMYNKILELDKTDTEIAVNITSTEFEMIDLQQYTEWVINQQRYMDIYNVFKDMLIFNFKDLYKPCPILHTFEQFIKNTGEIGFATKGYHLTKHISLFNQGVFENDDKYENYFLLLGKLKTAIYFTKCQKEPGQALHYSAQNIQITNALHEELQSKDIIQVNVLMQNDDEDVIFCTGCLTNNLCVNEVVLSNVKKFKSWFSKLKKKIQKLKLKTNVSNVSLRKTLLENIKKEMITFEASQNTDFPSFSYVGEDQMSEMKKCILLLTLVQYEILNTNREHIFLRGPYGCGKTIILIEKLMKILKLMNKLDIVYLICHDQQSQFSIYLESVRLQHPDKQIIVCNSKYIAGWHKSPRLSVILNHIKNVWKDRTVHVFIDEFNGSYLTKSEIIDLEQILPEFSNSFIVVALQSMEEVIFQHSEDAIDLGYQYELLKTQTSFVLYNLSHSLRCSSEINEFVRVTSKHISSIEVSVKDENFIENVKDICLDKEISQENNNAETYENISAITAKYLYNQSSQAGHSSSNGPVSIYIYDKFSKNSNQSNILAIDGVNKKNVNIICSVYIAAIDCILTDLQDDEKFVVCTFDKKLFNSIFHYFLNESRYNWTHSISKFLEKNSPYDILLIDYASVRGFEFPNLIFLVPLGMKHLKYRMIECMTRATTKLCIITDNVNVSEDSKDNELLKTWKQSNCVDYFECQVVESKNILEILHGGEVKYSKNLAVDVVQNKNMYPWIKSWKLFEKREDIIIRNDLYAAIHVICTNDNVDLLLALLRNSNIELSYCYDNVSILILAVMESAINICRYLILECGVNVNSHVNDRYIPLDVGILNNCFETVKLLIENNAKVDAKEEYGDTPLHIASRYGSVEIAKLLIQYNADVDALNADKYSPLHLAAHYGQSELAKILIENKASINATTDNGSGFTPLHLAAQEGHIKVVELLTKANADINATDDRGRTPLHAAARNGYGGVVQLLLENKGDVNVLDKFNKMPINSAQLFENYDIVELLEKF